MISHLTRKSWPLWLVAAAGTAALHAQSDEPRTSGPFAPTWQSLAANYHSPQWFRDAKFGIWAHWGPQSEAEDGDWYARNLYIYGSPQYQDHLARFGHPSTLGYKDLCNDWKAEHFDPQALMRAYKAAGARYFVALANHHDNFDLWDSRFQPWNAVQVGPKRDIIGAWAAAAAGEGLPFGVSIHASSSWSWFEVAQLSDPAGPKAGVAYDGGLTRKDGAGKWWDGLDPQDLYAQYGHRISSFVLDRREALRHPGAPPDKAYLKKYYNRVLELLHHYQPQLVYFDDSHLPLNEADGLKIVSEIYNFNASKHGGNNQAVVNTKKLTESERRALVFDFEVGVPRDILPQPWQVDACIGHWFYQRNTKYKRADQVVHGLIDAVSKNGNLLLSIPLRPDGTFDDEEGRILHAIGSWLQVNGEAIYGTRPWRRFGEGPAAEEQVPEIPKGGIPFYRHGEYVAEDIRYTTHGNDLYAIIMAWPASGRVRLRSLAPGSPGITGAIQRVELLGAASPLRFASGSDGLDVELPVQPPCEIAYALKISGLDFRD